MRKFRPLQEPIRLQDLLIPPAHEPLHVNKKNTNEFPLCLCTADLPRIVIPVAVSAGTTLVLVLFLVWLIWKRQRRRINNGDERRPLLGNRAPADQREPNAIPEQHPIPERHPIPVSSAGRAEGSSSIESDANIVSANVWGTVANSCLLCFAIDVLWRLVWVHSLYLYSRITCKC